MNTAPLLSAKGARIDADRSVLLDDLSLEVPGDSVGLVGGWEPLFRLLGRTATLARGSVEVLGRPAEVAAAEGFVGIAPRDIDLPTQGTVLDFLTMSARLLGLGQKSARRHAEETLASLGAAGLGRKTLASLHATERRAAAVIHAALGTPTVIALECPLAGLGEEAGTSIATLVERASANRKLVVSVDSPSAAGPEAELLARMGRVVLLAGGRVVAEGLAGDVLRPSRRYVLRPARASAALATALEERALRVERLDAGSDTGRLVVHLPEEGGTAPIVDAALATQAPLLEMLPVGFDAKKTGA